MTVSIESAAADDLEHTEELMSLLVSAGREHVYRAAVPSDPVFNFGEIGMRS